ncbi:MAG TPA: hypothetical protein VHR45_16185 [Thermoanaerobaculia bacterium]|nr:hypothetical protein [Thermoanaerobaculia bacterium]
MSEPSVPPPPPYQPPPSPPPAGGSVSQNRSIMIVLSYLWILAVVPLVVEKDDREVQWHAKHGLVLVVAELLLGIVVGILLHIPFLGCLVGVLWLVVWLGIVIVHILCIVKGVNGQRFIIPGISQYADRF